jgi:hypothetical protein
LLTWNSRDVATSTTTRTSIVCKWVAYATATATSSDD